MTATTTHPTSARSRRPNADQVTRRAAVPALAAGEDVDAISMPAAFGALVLAELQIMMLAGPVTADGGSFTFLTQRAGNRQPALPADLLRLGVRAIPAGTAVAAAGRAVPVPEVWWTVIGAARRVAHRTSRAA